MIIIVFVYLARVLVRRAAVVAAVAVAVAAVTGALLPLVAARVFTKMPTTIADITTIGLVAIALRHHHDAACRVRACRVCVS